MTRPPRHAARITTSSLRTLPDFLIIGAMKSGTTALYDYLCDLDDVRGARAKELQYFSFRWNRGIRWYRSQFPPRFRLRSQITGESSPYYLTHPLAAERARRTAPDTRIIAVLRNPVDRAYSHWSFETNRGYESLAFEAALAAETDRLAGMTEGQHDESGNPVSRHGYTTRGIYADDLRRWFEAFGRENIKVVATEHLQREPRAVIAALAEWLDVRGPGRQAFPPRNQGRYANPITPDTRRELATFFEPHNRRLFSLIGEDFDWGP